MTKKWLFSNPVCMSPTKGNPMLRNRFFNGLIALAALLAGACSTGSDALRQPVPLGIRDLVGPVQKSVVTIINYDLDGAASSIGSGFFISSNGILLTNYHVLDGAYSAAIRMADGNQYPIETVLARNPLVDLIKVKVDIPGDRLRPIALARDIPAVMDRVVVIGSPMGLEQTVSEGIISAIREMPAGGAVLQLTAPISPGSSGGPVLNNHGKAIGVVTFQAAKGQNLNFAISIDAMDLLTEESQGISIAEWTIRNSMKGPALAAMLCSKGARLTIRGEYEEALTYFEKAAKSNPDDPDAWYGLGSCYVGLDRADDAIAAYQRPIADDPDNALAHFILAMYYKTTGQYEQEIASLKQVIRIDPANTRARMELGRAYGALDRKDEQIAAYQAILADQPSSIPALLDLGMALERSGRPDEAIDLFSRARDLEPANELIHYNLGVIYNRMKRPMDAINAYVQAIRADPRMAPAHFNLGMTYLEQGHRKLALDEYEILKGLGADEAESLFNMIYPF